MAVIHGTLTASEQFIQLLTPDTREAGVLHKGNSTAPIYVAFDCEATDAGENTYTVLPGMRRWIPSPRTDTCTKIHMWSDGVVDWEIET